MKVVYTVVFCIGFFGMTFGQNRSFINSGFETPQTSTVPAFSFSLLNSANSASSQVSEWKTTATDFKIEVWSSGHRGVPAAAGNQFAELNANQVSRLYQDICLRNGETLNWSYSHRGRQGIDTLEFCIYNNTGTTKIRTLQSAMTGSANWAVYTGSYVVTEPSGSYQVSFESIGAAGGSRSIGNFLDQIDIGLAPIVEFVASTTSGTELLANNPPQLRVNGTVGTGGCIVTLSITGGSAAIGTDFSVTTTVSIPAGEYNPSSNFFTVPISLVNDGISEGNESFSISILSATNGMIIGDADCSGAGQSTGVYIILDDDCSPGKVLNTYLWLRGDVGITGTTSVSGWADQSGYGRNVSQGVVGLAPAWTSVGINFNPAVVFDGTNDYLLRSAGIFGTSTQTNFNVYAVVRTDQVKAQSLFWETEASSASNARLNLHLPYNDGNVYFDMGNVSPGGGRVSQAWGGTTGTYHFWSLNSSVAGTSPVTEPQAISRNGLKISTQANRLNSATFVGNNSPFCLGCNYIFGAPSEYFQGAVAELLMVNVGLTATDQQRIHSYLAIKYGITLDQSTLQNYLNSSGQVIYPTTSSHSAFINDIAGIGRDDNSCLDQRQSKAQGQTDIITIGLGTITGSNATNPYAFSQHNTYFVWGHNNLALAGSRVTDFDPAILQGRMARVWNSFPTGNVGTLKIRVNFASILGVNLIPGQQDLSKTRLVVDQDGIFAIGATYISPTFYDNTTDVAEYDVTFTSSTGYYFAIGTTDIVSTPLPSIVGNLDVDVLPNGQEVVGTGAIDQTKEKMTLKHSRNGSDWTDVSSNTVQITPGKISWFDGRTQPGNYFYALGYLNKEGDWKSISQQKIVRKPSVTFQIVPNPSEGGFTIHWTGIIGSEMQWQLCNGLGQIVWHSSISMDKSSLEVQGLAPGVYVLSSPSLGWLSPEKVVVK